MSSAEGNRFFCRELILVVIASLMSSGVTAFATHVGTIVTNICGRNR